MIRRIAFASLATILVAGSLAAQAAPQGTPPQGTRPQQGPPPPPLPVNGWRFDLAHSAVSFRVRHLGISWVNGRFKEWSGELVYDPSNPAGATVSVTIKTGSVDTENERRDADIRSGNYLAVDSFPEMSFVSKRVEKVDDSHLRVTGDLTLRGVTKSVTLDTEITGVMNGQRAKRIAFTATTVINRHDYGVAFNRLLEGAQIVGDDVRITIDIEAIQPIA
jgi:polyisoprenoid-binding protein YceI